MKKILGIMVLVFILIGPSYAAENNTVTIDTTKVKNFFKTLTGKTLKKDDSIKFLNEYAITIEDERGNGVVTYIFDEENYKRYKDFKVISEDSWRFTKAEQLRLFNTDIKLTWKIKLGKENNINIKTKYAPIGTLYPFTYEPKSDYLAKVEDFYNKEIAKKEREKQKKLEAKQKAEEEKKRLEQEKIEVQQKAEEEKKRLEQEKLEVQQKAEEEKKKLEEEKLKLQKEIEEQRKILTEEKERLEQEKLEIKKKLEQEKLYNELEHQFRKRCQKKASNDLYEIGTPEYRECILNKGPEKQLQKETPEDQQKAEEEKKRLEKEKLEAQQKAEEEKKRLEQEKLEAQQKAEEEKKRLEQEKLEAKQKAEEEKERLEQEKLEAQQTPEDLELKKLRNEQAELLIQTKDHWIEWRYFMERLMFYTTHLVSMRCGIDEAFYGFSKDKIDKDLKIGKPDKDVKQIDINVYELRQKLYKEYPSGCDLADPYNSFGIIIFEYLDEIDEEESDSLIGLDEETQSIKSIFIRIKYANGKDSGPVEFKIPEKVLREMNR